MDAIIAPSMLSADFGKMYEQTELVNGSPAGWFHLDIMDGVFVPNISFGFPVVKAIASRAAKPMDAHLMIVNPEKYIERFASLGVEWLSIHYEAVPRSRMMKTIALIKSCGMKAGIAINPATPVEVLIEYLHVIDYVVVMGVNPGFSGQKFFEETTEKVSVLSEMIAASETDVMIQVDGGVGVSNIKSLYDAGARCFVAGSAVMSQPDPVHAMEDLLSAL